VGEDGLRYELAVTRRMNPQPELHLRPDPAARYEVVDKVLADIKRSGVTKFGFVGNEAYALPR
jgi:biopolymer transport protein ExbD